MHVATNMRRRAECKNINSVIYISLSYFPWNFVHYTILSQLCSLYKLTTIKLYSRNCIQISLNMSRQAVSPFRVGRHIVFPQASLIVWMKWLELYLMFLFEILFNDSCFWHQKGGRHLFCRRKTILVYSSFTLWLHYTTLYKMQKYSR